MLAATAFFDLQKHIETYGDLGIPIVQWQHVEKSVESQAARALEAALAGDPSGFFGAWP